jgi:hypothetical protein
MCACIANAAFAAPAMSIKFAEAVNLPANAGKAQIDAYGRRFSLTLESNDRLLRTIPAGQKAAFAQSRVLRGTLDGIDHSWVRLTRVGKGLEGAIWDGNDIYVVTRYAEIADKLTTPLAAKLDQTVVYRLSDTLNALPEEFCGLADTATTGEKGRSALGQYKDLVATLQVSAASVSEQISISLIADKAFQDLAGANARDEMLARLNIADGIFSEQIGVLLAPSEFRLMPANADPFTKTEASGLLGQLSDYRVQTPAVAAAGLAHLMTGKDLDFNVVGIAYLDELCDQRLGASLSDSELGSFLSGLVMAHEIGHNFGAPHDGAAGACSTVNPPLLMAPAINGSTQFSACSINQMTAPIAAARGVCIGPATYVDLALTVPDSPYAVQTNGTFSLPITVHSLGTLVGTSVRLTVTVPFQFGLAGAALAGSNCTINSNVITCPLADVAPGENRPLDLQVTGTTQGAYTFTASIAVDNDRTPANNTGQVTLGIVSGIDLGISLVATPMTVFVGDTVDFIVDIASHSTTASRGGTAVINIGGMTIVSLDDGPHTCTPDVNVGVLNCQLGDIAANATTRITVRGRPTEAGNSYISAGVNNPDFDSHAENNSASTVVTVNAERGVVTKVSSEELRTVVNAPYELTYTLTTIGRFPTSNVRFTVQRSDTTVVEAVTTAGVTCVAAQGLTNCDFGTMNPGDVRTVVVRFHMTQIAPSFMSASTRWTGPAGNEFSSVYTQIYANLNVDVAAALGNNFGVFEGQTGEAGFSVETKGVDPAQTVTATIDLAPPLRLLTLTYSNGPTGWTCVVLTAQRGRCTGSFAGGSLFTDTFAVARYTYVSDTAVDGQATLTVAAPGDGDATNNVAQTTLQIRPSIDIGISNPTTNRLVFTGQTTELDATIITGRNPVPGAALVPWVSDASIVLESLTVNGVACASTESFAQCPLGTLPANSVIPVQATYRAVTGEGYPYTVLRVYPENDSVNTNNYVQTQIFTVDPADVQLTVAQATVSANNGTAFDFPLVTVTSGAATTRDVKVEIPLPAFTAIASMSAGQFTCIGTATLECTLSQIPPHESRSITIQLATSNTGTFASNITMTAFNDSTPANNAASVTVTVNAAPVGDGGGGGGSSSGGGGGGRIEWLMLAFLGAFALVRGCRKGAFKYSSTPSPPAGFSLSPRCRANTSSPRRRCLAAARVFGSLANRWPISQRSIRCVRRY